MDNQISGWKRHVSVAQQTFETHGKENSQSFKREVYVRSRSQITKHSYTTFKRPLGRYFIKGILKRRRCDTRGSRTPFNKTFPMVQCSVEVPKVNVQVTVWFAVGTIRVKLPCGPYNLTQ
jgi:hypothetical protein